MEIDWNRNQAIKIFITEYEASPIKKMAGWNHAIHIWLNRYVQ